MKSFDIAIIKKYGFNPMSLPYILGSIMFMEYFDGAALNLIFPELASSFNVSPIFMKISLTVYLITEAIFIPVCGYLSHKINLKTLLQVGIILLFIGSIGCVFSNNIISFIIFRSFQGISAAFITPICRLFVLKKFNKDNRLEAINKIMGIALIGLVMGPFLSAFLVIYYSWKLIFVMFAIFSGISLFITWLVIPSYKDEVNERFDIIGYLVLSLALVSFFAFFSMTINDNQNYIHVVFLIASILLLKIYFVFSRKNNTAIISRELIEDKQFLMGLLSNFIFRVLFGGVIFACSYMLQIYLKYPLIKSAICLSLYGMGMILGKILVKPITLNYGYKKLLVYNSLCLALLTLLISIEMIFNSFYILYLTLFIYGLSATVQYSGMNIVSLNEIKNSLHAKANVTLNIVRLLGTNFGISLSALFLGMQNVKFQYIFLLIFSVYGGIGLVGSGLFKKMNIG